MLPEVPRKQRLGDVLVRWGAITEEVLKQALAAQKRSKTRTRLGAILVANNLIDELTLAAALAEIHQLKLVDLDGMAIEAKIGRRLPQEAARRLVAVPISEAGNVVTVAVADPLDVVGADELRMRLKSQITFVVSTSSQIKRKIRELWDETVSSSVVDSFVDTLNLSNAAVTPDQLEDTTEEGAVGVVNQIIGAAAARKASDIHIESAADSVRVRIRADGTMQEILRLPVASQAPLMSRIKVMSGMDVVQRRVPQDGRIRINTGGRDLDLRVSTLPALHGESVVMRLLSNQSELPSMNQMGLSMQQIARLKDEMQRTQGFIIVTGPTGSGKSTSMYSMLTEYVEDDRKVITMEDPVEMELKDIVQVQIDEKNGVTFAGALRAALRQDPDVVLVGEVRDGETAELAVSAALTGHLVLTTLHTQDAMSAVDRLVYMGVPRYLVSASVGLVFAQRLLRRPCAFCAEPSRPDPATIDMLNIRPELIDKFIHGRGCMKCANSGYMGRVGVYEMLDMTDSVRAAFLDGENDRALGIASHYGFLSLRETAVDMASRGLTTLDEVLRATPKTEPRENIDLEDLLKRHKGTPPSDKSRSLNATELIAVPEDGQTQLPVPEGYDPEDDAIRPYTPSKTPASAVSTPPPTGPAYPQQPPPQTPAYPQQPRPGSQADSDQAGQAPPPAGYPPPGAPVYPPRPPNS